MSFPVFRLFTHHGAIFPFPFFTGRRVIDFFRISQRVPTLSHLTTIYRGLLKLFPMRNLWRRQRWQMLPYSVFDSDGDEKRKKSPNLSGGFMKQKSLRAQRSLSLRDTPSSSPPLLKSQIRLVLSGTILVHIIAFPSPRWNKVDFCLVLLKKESNFQNHTTCLSKKNNSISKSSTHISRHMSPFPATP